MTASLPKGFMVSGVSCGIKKDKKLDLALIYSEAPCIAKGMFTTNRIKSDSIKLTKENLKKGSAQAIIINSGNANCFVGKKGLKDARYITSLVAKGLNLDKKDVLIASTGIIGKPLPVKKIEKAIPDLIERLSRNSLRSLSLAIMTTDKKEKFKAIEINIDKKPIRLVAIGKGAGMIQPDLATMLCFILTDALISPLALKRALREAISDSFNSITVDGCMSTNDMVLILANGLAKNRLINLRDKNFLLFSKALKNLCLEIAKDIVRDAEGATKFIKITVKGADSKEKAKKIALSIANSNLFKSAMYGEDKNLGRIVSAIGQSRVDVSEEDIKIRISDLKKDEIDLEVLVGKRKGIATVYTSDLTPEYVKINARYS